MPGPSIHVGIVQRLDRPSRNASTASQKAAGTATVYLQGGGTFHLDQASQGVELDFFVLFSSIAGALGNVGQADYACANSFMDQFAAYRNRQVAANRRHGRTRSINWPLWRDGGMGIDAARLEWLQRTTGLQRLQTANGMRAYSACPPGYPPYMWE